MSQNLPDPSTAPELFDGVLQRRMVAYVIDFVFLLLIAIIIAFVGLIAGFLTLGLGWVAIPIVAPIAVLGYYAATLGSHRRATPGMQAMDIILTPTRGAPLDGWRILIHPLLFWITVWISWPLSLVFALFTPRQQMVHDLIAGTLMVRRSPMERHWGSLRASA
ncbi:Uncharacterized membrane protein YckC, RDD family [Devosia enhydra]|uniref:Uncharacterized membrane protein YckC, RDD family n=1 Tax=Devosia enhydra TaxID=665118 RepID=A0A1K2HTA7_9HYPH|nr:RDD family protein [Devosia enhydra]SFZ81323.1 Uncharacterized membrane protein YckC, RDD family [Devosia enhydra]